MPGKRNNRRGSARKQQDQRRIAAMFRIKNGLQPQNDANTKNQAATPRDAA